MAVSCQGAFEWSCWVRISLMMRLVSDSGVVVLGWIWNWTGGVMLLLLESSSVLWAVNVWVGMVMSWAWKMVVKKGLMKSKMGFWDLKLSLSSMMEWVSGFCLNVSKIVLKMWASAPLNE